MQKSAKEIHASKTSKEMKGLGKAGHKKKRSALIPWSVTLLIILSAVAVIFYGNTRKDEKPVAVPKKLANVEVMTIKTDEFIESLTLPAIIKADRVVTIKPEYKGVLERWFFPEGAEVEMNDVIAEIDTKSLRLSLEELEASLKSASYNVALRNIAKESARVNLTNIRKSKVLEEIALGSAESNYKLAKQQFDRIQKLKKSKLSTASQLEQAQNKLSLSKLAVNRAQENLQRAQLGIQSAELAIKEAKTGIELAEARIVELEASINLIKHKIEKGQLRSPFSGRLDEHFVQTGEMVSADVPIAKIFDLTNLRATINVPDRYIAFLNPDNEGTKIFIGANMPGAQPRLKAKLIIPGLPKLTGGIASGIELDAQIARIAQSSDAESNTFRVELRLPNPLNALKHGNIVRSKIEYLYYPEAVTIPLKSIQVTDAGPRVLVAEEMDNAWVVKTRNIEPLSIDGNNILIRGGLAPGDRLVVEGWKGLVSGEQVHILVEDGKFIKPETGKIAKNN